MYNINSHINVVFFQKTTGRSRERSASYDIKLDENKHCLREVRQRDNYIFRSCNDHAQYNFGKIPVLKINKFD